MSFYADPSFYLLLLVTLVPAVWLGVTSRSSKVYGFVVSCVMLGLMLGSDPICLAYLAFFLVLSLVSYKLVLGWFTSGDERAVLKYRVVLAAQIAPLVLYKIGVNHDVNILGFLGISYITFKAVQVLIEVRDGLITNMGMFDYLYFLVFFSPFTSGPIMRSRDFVANLDHVRTRDEYLQGILMGSRWILQGLVYRFVCEAITTWALWFVPQYLGAGSAPAELAECVLYGVNMFFDFAGYSLLAMGVGTFFSIDVPRNFNAPFCSESMLDYWNRWHMSLSYWLRDFVFMRVTRSLMKRHVFSNRTTTACVAFMANFILMGVWHGISWGCLIYGLYQGIALCICQVWQKGAFHRAHHKQPVYRVCAWVLTMVVAFVGFSVFSGQAARLLLG